MGSDTMKRVIASVVGVIIAATTSMTTTACLRYCRIVVRFSIPILPSSQHTMGSSKTTPITHPANSVRSFTPIL